MFQSCRHLHRRRAAWDFSAARNLTQKVVLEAHTYLCSPVFAPLALVEQQYVILLPFAPSVGPSTGLPRSSKYSKSSHFSSTRASALLISPAFLRGSALLRLAVNIVVGGRRELAFCCRIIFSRWRCERNEQSCFHSSKF